MTSLVFVQAKKKLFNNPVPSKPGGGTVFFVADDGDGGGHRYLSNRIEREEVSLTKKAISYSWSGRLFV